MPEDSRYKSPYGEFSSNYTGRWAHLYDPTGRNTAGKFEHTKKSPYRDNLRRNLSSSKPKNDKALKLETDILSDVIHLSGKVRFDLKSVEMTNNFKFPSNSKWSESATGGVRKLEKIETPYVHSYPDYYDVNPVGMSIDTEKPHPGSYNRMNAFPKSSKKARNTFPNLKLQEKSALKGRSSLRLSNKAAVDLYKAGQVESKKRNKAYEMETPLPPTQHTGIANPEFDPGRDKSAMFLREPGRWVGCGEVNGAAAMLTAETGYLKWISPKGTLDICFRYGATGLKFRCFLEIWQKGMKLFTLNKRSEFEEVLDGLEDPRSTKSLYRTDKNQAGLHGQYNLVLSSNAVGQLRLLLEPLKDFEPANTKRRLCFQLAYVLAK